MGISSKKPSIAGRVEAERRSSRSRSCLNRISSSDAKSFFQLAGHAPAHLQRRRAPAQLHEVLPLAVALDAFEESHVHERVTMDANQGGAELLLEGSQRILDEVFALE